jgi:hypothetical protein
VTRNARRGGRRAWLRKAAFGIVVGACGVAAWTVTSAGGAPDGILYPDLRSIVPPEQLAIEYGGPGARLLRFEHVIHNAGLGRLEVRPDYDPRSGTAGSVQRLYAFEQPGRWKLARETRTDGTFGFHPPHEHYHFPFAEHALFAVRADGGVGRRVAPSRKLGYCLGDTYIVARNARTPEPKSGLLYRRETCSDPRAMRGISPGWGDQYEADLEGQSIDVSGLADGEYWFASTADPGNIFRETDEGNNRTLVKIRLAGASVSVLATR